MPFHVSVSSTSPAADDSLYKVPREHAWNLSLARHLGNRLISLVTYRQSHTCGTVRTKTCLPKDRQKYPNFFIFILLWCLSISKFSLTSVALFHEFPPNFYQCASHRKQRVEESGLCTPAGLGRVAPSVKQSLSSAFPHSAVRCWVMMLWDPLQMHLSPWQVPFFPKSSSNYAFKVPAVINWKRYWWISLKPNFHSFNTDKCSI